MLYQLIISLPMMVCLFWTIFFAVRMFRGNDEPSIKWAILLFYIASTVLYINHWLYFSGNKTYIGSWLYLIANLSVYPLYYVYLRALTRTHAEWDNFVLFVPAAIITVFFPLNMHYEWIEEALMLNFARACFAIQVIWVWVCGYNLLAQTQLRLDNTYADNRSYLLRPTHILLLLIGITAVVSTLLNILGRAVFDGSWWISIPAVLMSVLLFSLGYVAAHTALPQETVAQEEVGADVADRVRRATTEETDELMHRISKALREQKIFTNPHLTIQDLAAAVGSNRTYVSNCINRRTGLSFSQYVARYRVEHAQAILRDPKYTNDHESISEAISLSGFASDQTFYRVFKDVTGTTPLLYRQQNLQK